MSKKRGRKRNWPPAVRLHPQSGQARCWVDGQWHYLGQYGSPEAQEAFGRLLVEHAVGPPAPAAPFALAGLSVLELAARWQALEAPRIDAREANHYRHALVVLARTHGALPVAQFTVARLIEARDAMTSGSWMSAEERARAQVRGLGQRPIGWSRTHTNRQIVRVRTLWRWAEERELVPAGSWHALCALKGIPRTDRSVRQQPRPRPAYRDDLEAALAHVRQQVTRAMYTIQYHTGMRSGEVRRMLAGEVCQVGEVWLYRPRQHKREHADQARVVALGPQAMAVLGPYLKGKRPDQFVFLTRTGRPYTAHVYGHTLTRAGRKVGRPWLRPYCLRHGAKQRFLRELGLDAARAALGQRSLGTANDYGDQADLALALEVARRCG